MRDTDKLLIGTSWTRSGSKHSPITAILDGISDRGPKLREGVRHIRIVWAELGFSWVPTDHKTERAYQLWKMADHINYLDEKDAEIKSAISAQQEPIESETTLVEIARGTNLDTGTKECHGAWHRKNGKNGQPTTYARLPLSDFGIASHGPNKGSLAAVCISCNEKNKASPSHLTKRVVRVQKAALPPPVVEPVKIEPGVATETGIVYRWKVTVVQPTDHYVQAKDFLDAAAQVASLGEVTKVEKL